MPPKTAQSQQPRILIDLTLVRNFIKYFLIFYIPFLILGLIFGIINKCFFKCAIGFPIIYSGGFAAIIIVIIHDIDDILALIGMAKQPQLALHIKYAGAVQDIGVRMSARDYDAALETVNTILGEEPKFTSALNLKGQILLEGFHEAEQALFCFKKVLRMTKEDSEDYRLAQALSVKCERMLG